MNSSNAAAKTSGNHSFGRSAAVGIYYFINRMINFWINMSQVLEAVVSQVGVVNSFTACLSWFSIVSFRVITKSFRRNWLLLFLLHQFSQSTDIRSSPAKITVLQAKRISSPILCEGRPCQYHMGIIHRPRRIVLLKTFLQLTENLKNKKNSNKTETLKIRSWNVFHG